LGDKEIIKYFGLLTSGIILPWYIGGGMVQHGTLLHILICFLAYSIRRGHRVFLHPGCSEWHSLLVTFKAELEPLLCCEVVDQKPTKYRSTRLDYLAPALAQFLSIERVGRYVRIAGDDTRLVQFWAAECPEGLKELIEAMYREANKIPGFFKSTAVTL
jgi:hypothetical protein